MARAKKKSGSSSRGKPGRAGSARGNGKPLDAIALLKADHRQVEEWFGQFEKARDDNRRQKLAGQICTALKIHTIIEEEIFYPAFLEATQDDDLTYEAEVEHDGAKKLIVEIQGSSPDDDYFEARVSVLSEMIKHHVKEEEQRGGMFSEAREAGLDLQALGEKLAQRKSELEGNEAETNANSQPGNLGKPRAAASRAAPAQA